MGNPSLGITVQTTMLLSKKLKHRQSLSMASLQLEKLGHQEKVICNEFTSTRAHSPTEDKSFAPAVSNKPVQRRTRSSLSGTDDFLEGLEPTGGTLTTEDRKAFSLLQFRGHKKIASGNIATQCQPSEKLRPNETSFRKERSAVAKLTASLFDSPTKLERSMSLSRVSHKEILKAEKSARSGTALETAEGILPSKRLEPMVSRSEESATRLDTKLQPPAATGGVEKLIVSLACKDKEGFAGSLISKASLQQNSCGITIESQKEEGADGIAVPEGSPKFTGASSESSDIESQAFEDALESSPTSLASTTRGVLTDIVNYDELLKEQASCTEFGIEYSFTGGTMRSSTPTKLPVTVSSSSENPHCLGDAGKCTLITASSNSHSRYRDVGSECVQQQESVSTIVQDVVLSDAHCSLGSQSARMVVIDEAPVCSRLGTSSLSSSLRTPLDPFHLDSKKVRDPTPLNLDSAEEDNAAGIIQRLPFATDKVTEEELTEAAVLSSLMCEENPTGPVLTSEESQQSSLASHDESKIEVIPFTEMINETKLNTNYKPDAHVTKSNSFEPGIADKTKCEGERRSKLRKRRRSVSASGIGAMLLKVVRVSDSGPIVTRRLPKVGPEVAGVDALRARAYVIQKTAQIPMGLAELRSPTFRRSDSENEVISTHKVKVHSDLESAAQWNGLLHPCDAHQGVHGTGVSAFSDPESKVKRIPLDNAHLAEAKDGIQSKRYNKGDVEPLDGFEEEATEGSQVLFTCETRSSNKLAAAGRLSEKIPRKLSDEEIMNADSTGEVSGMTPSLEDGVGCLNESEKQVDSDSSPVSALDNGDTDTQTVSAPTSADLNISSTGSTVIVEERCCGRPKKKPNSRGRNSYDFDTLTESLKSTNSSRGLGQGQMTTHINKQALSLLDENVAISRERSRSFVSRLQAPSGLSVDVYRMAPSSISILTNPSFSSSHQDRLWEEQADAYSSGGRGTPGREDEAAANVFLHSPSPGGAISSDDQILSTSGSLKRRYSNANVEAVPVDVEDKGRGNDKKKGQGKTRERPRTPLRSLLAEDGHSRGISQGTKSPEGGHFIQQIMSCIRRQSSKTSNPKSPEALSKRRSNWSSCICFCIN